MQKNLLVWNIICTFALAFEKQGVGLTTYSKLRKVGWVAETTSLLNWRAGYRTGGSNPPPSAPVFYDFQHAVFDDPVSLFFSFPRSNIPGFT